jgi:hypothetical protein
MAWDRRATSGAAPPDPAADLVAEALGDLFQGADVQLVYSPATDPAPRLAPTRGVTSATGDGPNGWRLTIVVGLTARIAPLVTAKSVEVLRLLDTLPGAALRTAARFRPGCERSPGPPGPTLRRALRDTLAIELLATYAGATDRPALTDLVAETVEYLIELGGARVESNALTHGVIITDALTDRPRLRFRYPADLRAAKRAPLLFDGEQSVLVVDCDGHARTELQRHRMDRWAAGAATDDVLLALVDTGALVAEATARLAGVGFFLRADRTIWTFVNGRPLVLRRGEHWTTFPVQLTAFIDDLIGGGRATEVVVQAALIVSALDHGGILAIVDRAEALDDVVSPKDRYDLRNEFDPAAMRPETRLHHLLDAGDLDEQTLARLAGLDGATVVDRNANLIAYGAIVASADSEHEGARTAAAKSLSHHADVVLKVSEDGDITVFHQGVVLATLLGTGTSAP